MHSHNSCCWRLSFHFNFQQQKKNEKRNFLTWKDGKENKHKRGRERETSTSYACELSISFREFFDVGKWLHWNKGERERTMIREGKAHWWKIWTICINYLKEFYLKCSLTFPLLLVCFHKEVIGKWRLKWIHCHDFTHSRYTKWIYRMNSGVRRSQGIFFVVF